MKIGDYIQWHCNGADQFDTPKRVRDLSDCGGFVFVEDSQTGLPLDQVTVIVNFSSESPGRRDRYRGALYGLAIGDALGGPVEFRERGEFSPVTCYRSGGPHSLAPGQWTDDTSLALALADSIANVGWDLNDQMSRYVDWFENGTYSVNGWCFDIGCTTRAALNQWLETKDAKTAGDRSPEASGNGSIMRLAPVPIRYHYMYPSQINILSRLAEESSLTTHASEQCLSACRYMALILAGLIHGEERDKVLSPNWEALKNLTTDKPLHSLIQQVATSTYKGKPRSAIQGSGWVVKSLEAALWAFQKASSFEEAVLEAVNLGDDSDTTGAVWTIRRSVLGRVGDTNKFAQGTGLP